MALLSTQPPNTTLQKISQFGLNESWTDIETMAKSFNFATIGWQIKVEYRESSIPGMKTSKGIYTMENIKKGQILRIGQIDQQVIEMRDEQDAPPLVNKVNGCKEQCHVVTFNYLTNYGFRYKSFPEGKVYIWVPGNGLNHGSGDDQFCHQVFDEKSNSIHVVASKDIPAGQEMYEDYNNYGDFPEWYNGMMERHGAIEHLGLRKFLDG